VAPAADEAADEIARPPTMPKERVWIEDVTFKTGDAVVWFPRALAEMCADDAFKKELQVAGLLEGATKLAARDEAEVRGVVLDAQPPMRGCSVRSLVLSAGGEDESYALPHVSPLVPGEVPQHVVQEKLYDEAVGKFGEGDHVSVTFAAEGGELRDDGAAIRGEVWEGRVTDVDTSAGAYESLHVLWYERVAQTGAWILAGVQNDNAISPWQCEPSKEHACFTAKYGPIPANRRVVYSVVGRNLNTKIDDALVLEPADDSIEEAVRVAILRLSTLESSEPFIRPVPAAEVAYHALVEHPICLLDMQRKAKAKAYATFDALKADVNLLINNALVGNAEDTLVFHQARELSKEWERTKEVLASTA
jgi:hypothetical protein